MKRRGYIDENGNQVVVLHGDKAKDTGTGKLYDVVDLPEPAQPASTQCPKCGGALSAWMKVRMPKRQEVGCLACGIAMGSIRTDSADYRHRCEEWECVHHTGNCCGRDRINLNPYHQCADYRLRLLAETSGDLHEDFLQAAADLEDLMEQRRQTELMQNIAYLFAHLAGQLEGVIGPLVPPRAQLLFQQFREMQKELSNHEQLRALMKPPMYILNTQTGEVTLAPGDGKESGATL